MLFIVNCVHTCKIDCVVTVMKCIDSNNKHVGIPLFNLICTLFEHRFRSVLHVHVLLK